MAAGLAGALLLTAPAHEHLLWRRIGVVGLWGRGSMGRARQDWLCGCAEAYPKGADECCG